MPSVFPLNHSASGPLWSAPFTRKPSRLCIAQAVYNPRKVSSFCLSTYPMIISTIIMANSTSTHSSSYQPYEVLGSPHFPDEEAEV